MVLKRSAWDGELLPPVIVHHVGGCASGDVCEQAEEASALRDILSAINRSSSVELAFTKVKSRQLRRLWEEFDGAVQGVYLCVAGLARSDTITRSEPMALSARANMHLVWYHHQI